MKKLLIYRGANPDCESTKSLKRIDRNSGTDSTIPLPAARHLRRTSSFSCLTAWRGITLAGAHSNIRL
jgi:hypothetical protein